MDDDPDPPGGLDPSVSREELNLTCYNLMVDVVASQLEQQDVEKHVGLLGPHVNETLALVNKMLATPWFSIINKCLVRENIIYVPL